MSFAHSSRRDFFLRLGTITLGAGLPRFMPGEAPATATFALPRSNPMKEGVAASGILDFLGAIEKAGIELHSFMLLRHGKVVAEGWWEPYGPDFVHTMYSMSKSFTSTAVGFAVAEGKMTVEEKVISFFPKDLPEKISDNLAKLQVKHLLTMATGNEKEPTGTVTKEENWVRTFLAQNFAHEPGSVFMYNSAATYMCSAIVQKVTGQRVLDYLTPRLFSPLGSSGMRWETCPRGINTGGWGLSIQTESLAKFGQLLLQKGKWEERQILPAAWIDEATKFHIQQPGGDKPDRPKAKNDWLQGYGYQFWRCTGTAFRGDGAFGQFTVVMPDQDAVLIMTSESKNMQGQLDLAWQHLLPSFEVKNEGKPNSETYITLVSQLGSLKIEPLKGAAAAPTPDAARINGKTFKLEKNDLGITRVKFAADARSCQCLLTAGDKIHTVPCGLDDWVRGEAAVPGTPPRLLAGGGPKKTPVSKVAGRFSWNDPDTLVMRWQYYETPHHDIVTCKFIGDELTMTFASSIGKTNPWATLKGTLDKK